MWLYCNIINYSHKVKKKKSKKKQKYIPAQTNEAPKQSFISWRSPGQPVPFSQVLFLLRTPTPQVTEHADQGVHSVSDPNNNTVNYY